MSTYILTSMFHNGFNAQTAEVLRQKIGKRNRFAFVASEFQKGYEKTDMYFRFFLNMFEEADIHFEEASVIDGRIKMDEAQKKVAEADVIWLSGGDTPTQFRYFQEYGLDTVIKQHNGVIIGMSAGSINMAKTSICTSSCGHYNQKIYNGLACVDISVEPHFVRDHVSNELLDLSMKYIIYGLCDDSFIICSEKAIEFYGEIYKLSNGIIERL
ncbi:MAG: Type 1 glutamine amidotransferase-like domain-containing protein [Clostridia bacterium]|nr:Type 1 glutamine amidotransferase-like domain-containing protein [Clostridia bacterium]